MVNQGQNHIDSPANMLQQQASYEVSAVIIFQSPLQSPYQVLRKETSTNRLRLISLQPNNFPPSTFIMFAVQTYTHTHQKEAKTKKLFFRSK